MLAFFRRPRTKRLREYEGQLAVQVTVFAIRLKGGGARTKIGTIHAVVFTQFREFSS